MMVFHENSSISNLAATAFYNGYYKAHCFDISSAKKISYVISPFFINDELSLNYFGNFIPCHHERRPPIPTSLESTL